MYVVSLRTWKPSKFIKIILMNMNTSFQVCLLFMLSQNTVARYHGSGKKCMTEDKKKAWFFLWRNKIGKSQVRAHSLQTLHLLLKIFRLMFSVLSSKLSNGYHLSASQPSLQHINLIVFGWRINRKEKEIVPLPIADGVGFTPY